MANMMDKVFADSMIYNPNLYLVKEFGICDNPNFNLQKMRESLDMIREDLNKGIYFEMKHNLDRKSTRLNSSHIPLSRMPSSA